MHGRTAVYQFSTPVSQINKADIRAAQCYMFYSCVFALVCSAWTLSNYIDGSITMRAYAWIGTIASALLLLGLLAEGATYVKSPSGTAYRYAESARQKGIGVSTVHVATATIGIFSVCVAAVNIYGKASDGLYAMSCIVIVVNWLYYVLFTPNTIMHLAVAKHLSEPEHIVLIAQQHALQLVWRRSSIMPSASTESGQ